MCKWVESVQRLCGLSELSVRTAGKYNRKNGKQTCVHVTLSSVVMICVNPNLSQIRIVMSVVKLSARAAMVKLISKADGIIRHAVVDVGFEVAGAALKSKSSNTQQNRL